MKEWRETEGIALNVYNGKELLGHRLDGFVTALCVRSRFWIASVMEKSRQMI